MAEGTGVEPDCGAAPRLLIPGPPPGGPTLQNGAGWGDDHSPHPDYEASLAARFGPLRPTSILGLGQESFDPVE